MRFIIPPDELYKYPTGTWLAFSPEGRVVGNAPTLKELVILLGDSVIRECCVIKILPPSDDIEYIE